MDSKLSVKCEFLIVNPLKKILVQRKQVVSLYLSLKQIISR